MTGEASGLHTGIRAELKAQAEDGATYHELIQYLDDQGRGLRDRPLSEYYELSRYCWALTRRQLNRSLRGVNGARRHEELGA